MDNLIDDLMELAEDLDTFAADDRDLADGIEESLHYAGFCAGRARGRELDAQWLRRVIKNHTDRMS